MVYVHLHVFSPNYNYHSDVINYLCLLRYADQRALSDLQAAAEYQFLSLSCSTLLIFRPQ